MSALVRIFSSFKAREMDVCTIYVVCCGIIVLALVTGTDSTHFGEEDEVFSLRWNMYVEAFLVYRIDHGVIRADAPEGYGFPVLWQGLIPADALEENIFLLCLLHQTTLPSGRRSDTYLGRYNVILLRAWEQREKKGEKKKDKKKEKYVGKKRTRPGPDSNRRSRRK
ncbi:hypothetical protein F4861DRAFT_416711 [Xylaria intraflava]|nr:hypothetical protein F4861DRAFT_416711 [Xylaria intraflava]